MSNTGIRARDYDRDDRDKPERCHWIRCLEIQDGKYSYIYFVSEIGFQLSPYLPVWPQMVMKEVGWTILERWWAGVDTMDVGKGGLDNIPSRME